MIYYTRSYTLIHSVVMIYYTHSHSHTHTHIWWSVGMIGHVSFLKELMGYC